MGSGPRQNRARAQPEAVPEQEGVVSVDYKKVAEQVVEGIGGAGNVRNVSHCITRLRFTLADESKADTEAVKDIDGVVTVIQTGGQYQVVIGNEVNGVYREVVELTGADGGEVAADDADAPAEGGKKKITVASVTATISSIFTPFLSVLTAAGMLSAVLVLCSTFGLIDSSSETYTVINAIANAGFYFLPVMVAYTTAKIMNSDQFLAVMMAGVLISPTLMGTGLTVFGFTIPSVTYSSTVLPAILTTIFMAYVERGVDKICPAMLKFFLVPLVTVIVTAPVSLFLLGPLGYNLGVLLADFISFLSNQIGFVATGILAAIYPLMVMTGMHHAYAPVALASIASLGYEAVMAPGALCANIAQGGAALAVGVRSKDVKTKSVALSGGFSCLLGVSEPVMYGVTLQHKSALIATMIGGACGGVFAGLTGVKAVALASPGLASIAIFLGDTFVFALIAIAISFVVGFAVSFVTYKDE